MAATYYEDSLVRLMHGDVIDCLRSLPDNSVHCAVTSPPYFGLRSYLPDGHADKGKELGSEDLHDCAGWATGNKCGACFICRMVAVFAEVRRVLRPDGTLWLNIGDSMNDSGGAGGDYAAGGLKEGQPKFKGRHARGLKPKDMCLIPARLALALQAEGWWVRSQIVWSKTAPMPESAQDRPTSSWEPIWLLTKQSRYFYDAEATREPATYGELRATFRGGGTYTNNQSYDNSTKVAGDGEVRERPETTGRAQRNVWILGPDPYPEAHFATFVREIPRRAIRAGTSEKGCCPACAAPWVRVREPSEEYAKHLGTSYHDHSNDGVAGMMQPKRTTFKSVRAEYNTTGWQPTCTCNAGDPIPCTVLEPFAGSGTTNAVATELGRYSIGIDLSAEYLDLAIKRVQAASLPLFAPLVPVRPTEVQQASLF